MRIDLFVSYAREDANYAQQIIKKLEKNRISIWWDTKIGPASKNYKKEISSSIEKSQCFLVIWSSNSINSDWVLSEVDLAESKTKPKVIHVRIGDKVPLDYRLRPCQKLTIDKNEISDESLEKLGNNVKELIGTIGPNEYLMRSNTTAENWNFNDLAIETPVPGLDIFLSFRPCGSSGVFLLMRLDTSDGWVKDNIESAVERHKPFENIDNSQYIDELENRFIKVENDVLFIMDPLRPYSIQIGTLRSKRPGAKPGIISGNIPEDQLKALPTNLE